jgi:predicted exporter
VRASPHGLRLLAALAALAGLAAAVFAVVPIRADIAILLPEGEGGALGVLSRSLREGTANRTMMLALGRPDAAGPIASPGRLSRAFLDALQKTGRFDLVSNGGIRLDKAAIEPFFRYRYNLYPPPDPASFSAAGLRAALERLLRELHGFGGAVLKQIMAADPTLRTMQVATLWKPPPSPTREGVWTDKSGARVLLLARSKAAGFDYAAQTATIADIRGAAKTLEAAFGPLALTLSGPSVIAVESQDIAQRESRRLLLISLPLVAGILLLFLRNPMMLLPAFLPLGYGFTAGAAAVSLVFGDVHVTTLGFGVTLLGIAVDYPLHVMAHLRSDAEPMAVARRIWPALRIAAATTILAFAPLAVSSFPGLAQLGVFTITGLAVAAGMTRWGLPYLLAAASSAATAPTTKPGKSRRAAIRAGRALAVIAGLAAIAVLALRAGPLWQQDLATLSPIPEGLRQQDMALRRDLNVPDPRDVLTVDGGNVDAVLRKSEALLPLMQRLQDTGAIEGFDMAARYLPSKSTQQRWLADLPDTAALGTNLATAASGLPFRPGTFEPFLADMRNAREAGPIGLSDLAGSPLAARLDPLILDADGDAKALILLRGLRKPAELRSMIADSDIAGVHYLDIKEAAQNLLDGYRRETLRWVALGALLAFGLVVAAVRSVRGVAAVTGTVALSVLIAAAVLVLTAGGLSIFHLLGLLMVVGLGIDYAIFLGGADESPAETSDALRAVTLCAATSVAVFALLATAAIPILSQIGLTVAMGSVLSWLLAILFAAPGLERTA